MMRILLVEDMDVAVRMVSLALRDMACDLDVASSGAEALEAVRGNRYDLILMDLGLPDMDGITVTETIRGLGVEDTPIVALTAHDDAACRQNAADAGMDGYYVKPITAEGLQDLLDTYAAVAA